MTVVDASVTVDVTVVSSSERAPRWYLGDSRRARGQSNDLTDRLRIRKLARRAFSVWQRPGRAPGRAWPPADAARSLRALPQPQRFRGRPCGRLFRSAIRAAPTAAALPIAQFTAAARPRAPAFGASQTRARLRAIRPPRSRSRSGQEARTDRSDQVRGPLRLNGAVRPARTASS